MTVIRVSEQDTDRETVIRVSEQDRNPDGSFSVRVAFDDRAEYDLRLNDPAASSTEDLLAWYFEEHLRFPFLDADLERQAVQQIDTYGRGLFGQVFGGLANHDYRTLREQAFDRCRLEVAGSAAFHLLHWELLRDPDMDAPLAVRLPVTRRVAGLGSKFDLPPERTTLNVLVVTARPFGSSDVGYRTICRPLLDAMRQSILRVAVDLVRPGTWDALSGHLQEQTSLHGSGWYQVIHFDMHGAFSSWADLGQDPAEARLTFGNVPLTPFEGKRPFLFFETAEDGKAAPVPATAVASLLGEHRIPVAVLNACQSAMQDGSEASLAQHLAEAGVPVAVGMAYSVTVSAAALAIPVLYRQVTQRGDPVAAVHAARRALYEMTSRRAYFGQQIDLQDWALPVTFRQREVKIRLGAMGDEDQARFYQRRAVVGNEPSTAYGFVGRDLDIQAIERQLLTKDSHNEILIRGMAGAGKSTLLRHLAWWWQRTSLTDEVFAYSYEDSAWTCSQIIRDIQTRLFTEGERDRAEYMSEPAQLEQVADLLRAHRHLLILDNAESITASPGAIPHALDPGERARIKTLLSRVRGGRTLVLVGSRESEEWLAEGCFGTNRYELPGLDPQAASDLADLILRHHGATHWLHEPTERAALQELIVLLDGSPLPMTVVLPRLASNAPSAVVAELRTGEANADPAGKIGRAIEYSHGKLDPALQGSLLLLGPFTAVISTEALNRYRELLLQDETVQAVGQADLDDAVAEAVRVGLATPHPNLRNMVQVQPVLPYFLRSRLHDRPALRDAAERAHYQLYCELSSQLLDVLSNSKDPRQRAGGSAFARANYSNFTTALRHGLRTGQPILDLIGFLAEYLRDIHQYDSCRKLLDETIAAYPNPAGPAQLLELVMMHDQAGATAVAEHRLEDAKRHYDVTLQLCQALDEPLLKGSIYGSLGMVAFEEGQYEVAESHYREALGITLAHGDRFDAASTYHQLGIICQMQHRVREAEDYYREALAIYQEHDDRRETADVFNQLAQVAVAQGNPAEAEENYRNALSVYLDFHDQVSAAKIYGNLGSLAEELGRTAEAGTYHRRALDIQLKMGDERTAAYTYHNLGVLAHRQGRCGEARACYRRALGIHLKFEDQLGAASAYRGLGGLDEHEGQYPEAEAAYQRALQIYQETDDHFNIAYSLNLLGQAAVRQGKASEAEKHYRVALKIYLELGSQNEIAQISQNLGFLLFRLQHGRDVEAETCYKRALEIYLETGNEHGIAAVCQSLGNLTVKQQRYPEAERIYSTALIISIKAGNRMNEGAAYQGLGTVARDQRLYDKAEASYRKSLEISAELDYREMASMVGTQLGIILARLERHTEATTILIDAAVIYRADKGEWDIDDRRWLHRERSVLGEAAFSRLIDMGVPPDLREEIYVAIESVQDPEE